MWKPLIAVALIAGSTTGDATAQVYPARPVTMVVPFAAGGSSDTIGRIMADGMRTPRASERAQAAGHSGRGGLERSGSQHEHLVGAQGST
jgi:tripartite-type tricarboxylate transporter receptor subunit TctC